MRKLCTKGGGGNVGKDYWITVAQFCEKASLVGNCTILDDGAPPHPTPPDVHLKIDGLVSGLGGPFYHVVLDDGRTGYIWADYLRSGTDIDPVKAAADCKRRGDPRIGMSAKQVEATCWGKPDHVNRSETAGTIFDQYVYGDTRYVYLTNGVVTSIQTSGKLR